MFVYFYLFDLNKKYKNAKCCIFVNLRKYICMLIPFTTTTAYSVDHIIEKFVVVVITTKRSVMGRRNE